MRDAGACDGQMHIDRHPSRIARWWPAGIIDTMEIFLPIAIALWWFACAVTAGIIATNRYLNGVVFFCIGLFVLGPLTVAVALLAAPGSPQTQPGLRI